MESFRALKFSNQESFRALKFSFRVLDFRVRKFSNLESFRALKLSNHESFNERGSWQQEKVQGMLRWLEDWLPWSCVHQDKMDDSKETLSDPGYDQHR